MIQRMSAGCLRWIQWYASSSGKAEVFPAPALGASCTCWLIQQLVAALPACDPRILPEQAVGCSLLSLQRRLDYGGWLSSVQPHLGCRSTRPGSWWGQGVQFAGVAVSTVSCFPEAHITSHCSAGSTSQLAFCHFYSSSSSVITTKCRQPVQVSSCAAIPSPWGSLSSPQAGS